MPRRPSSEFLCDSYTGVSPSGSNSNVPRLFHPRRGESPCSISLCLSDSRSSACTSRTSGYPIGCDPCVVQAKGPSASIHTGFIYRGRFSSVEFLWRSGPVSRRYETVPSLFSARAHLRRAPNCSSPTAAGNRGSGDVRFPAAGRGACRDRPDTGRPSGRSTCGHPDPSGVRYRIGAARPIARRSISQRARCRTVRRRQCPHMRSKCFNSRRFRST